MPADAMPEHDGATGRNRRLRRRSGARGRGAMLGAERPCKDRELVYAAVLADGTNLGPKKMAEATDDPRVTYERLAWAADWHVREETYQRAIAEVVNAHYRLPFSRNWGEGRTSSSDGQVFFAGGPKDALSQPNARYGRDRGVAFYRHVSDQYAPFYSRGS